MGSLKLQRCDCCAQPVTVHTSVEGTGSYDPACENMLKRVTVFLDGMKKDPMSTTLTSFKRIHELEAAIREVLNAPNS